jgi:hypothetical protein
MCGEAFFINLLASQIGWRKRGLLKWEDMGGGVVCDGRIRGEVGIPL